MTSAALLGANSQTALGGTSSPIASVIDRAIADRTDLIKIPEVAAAVTVNEDGIITGDFAGTPYAEMEDMLRMARDRGQTGEELVAYDAMHEKQRAVVQLGMAHEETFAGYSLDPGAGWIGFVGAVPNDVANAAREVDGMVVEGGRPYTAAVLEAVQEVATTALTVATKADLAAMTDERTSTLVIRSSLDPENARAIATNALKQHDLPVPRIDAQFVEKAGGGSDDNMRGGGHLEGDVNCTAGFSIIATGGSKRMATAGHCVRQMPSGGTYFLHPVDGSSSTGYNPGWNGEGTYGDNAYVTHGTFTPYPTFYYQLNSKRYVYRQRYKSNILEGDRVCHYGRATGASCAYVEDADQSITFDGINHQHLVRMDKRIDQRGDSGGPWYYGNDAFGVHSGWSDYWCGLTQLDQCSTFSPLWLMNSVGLTVMTQ